MIGVEGKGGDQVTAGVIDGKHKKHMEHMLQSSVLSELNTNILFLLLVSPNSNKRANL